MRAPSPDATLPNLLAFCTTFELGSFSKAARSLGVTPQAVSRSVVRLEETLGVSLFRRTTRSLAATDAARVYYRSARQALDLLARAERELAPSEARLRGRVRVSVPTSYGHHRLLPSLARFRELHPEIALDVHVGNRNVDFTREPYDLAVRLGSIRTKGLIARKLGDFPLGVYAAPSYLARRGTPKHPRELADHDCISFVMPSTGRVLPWTFGARRANVTPRATLRCSEDILALVTLARAGLGLVQTYDFLVTRELERGELVEVMRDHRGASRPFSLVYPSTPTRSPAARALIELVLDSR